MSFQYAQVGNIRRTEWLWPSAAAGRSSYLRDGESCVTNIEWCEREKERLVAKGTPAEVRYNTDGQVAVFAMSEYTNYRLQHEESYDYDPTAGAASGGGQSPAPVQEPELPYIESM